MSKWRGVGRAYEASYASLCAGTADAILAGLGPAGSRTLLDVGAGTGALAARLADAGWLVTACEPEPSMREICADRHPSLPLIDGALPGLPIPTGAYDAVAANFVLNHVPDPRAAAREMARVAKPGAALVASVWTLSPSWFWAAVCERAGLPAAVGHRLPADKDFERTATGFGRMLAEGGWHSVQVTELSWTWEASPETLWASAAGGVASAGVFYLSLSGHDRSRFREAFDHLCDEFSVDDRIELEHTAAVAVGLAG